MTTPQRPLEPLNDNERDLARIVRALPGGEPSMALDARILKAASNATAASSKRHVGWWVSGIGTAAAAVLAIGVSWQMRHTASLSIPTERSMIVNEQESEPLAASPEVKQELPRELDHSSSLSASRSDSFSHDEIPSKNQKATEQASTKTIAPATPHAALSPFPGIAAENKSTDTNEAGDIPMTRTDSTVMGILSKDTADAEKLRDANTLEERQETIMQQDSGKAAAPAMANAPTGMQSGERANAQSLARMKKSEVAPSIEADFGDNPETWLKQIRQLQKAGKFEEAKLRLNEFEQRFPDYVVPSDLRPLSNQ